MVFLLSRNGPRRRLCASNSVIVVFQNGAFSNVLRSFDLERKTSVQENMCEHDVWA